MVHNSLEIITPLSEKQQTRHELGHSLIEVIEEYQALSFIKGREDLINLFGYISLLTKITVAAVEAFEQKDWPKFDALVGDCGCQMRAAKINDLADLFNISEEWRQEIATTKGEAQQILEQLPALLKQIKTFIINDTCFIEKYGVSVTASFICKELRICQKVSLDIRFIIESFLLTETKMVTPNKNCFYKNYYEATNPSLLSVHYNTGLLIENEHVNLPLVNGERSKKCDKVQNSSSNLKKVGIIGKNKLIHLVRAMQRDLASLSIEYSEKEAKKLKSTQINLYAQDILNKYIRNDELSRPCIPLFYCMESLMQRIIAKAQYVLIDITRWTTLGKFVDHLNLLYVGNPETKSLQMVSLQQDFPECVIVFNGCSVSEEQTRMSTEEYIKMFNSYTFEEILNVLAAQHPQYPGKMDEKHSLPIDFRLDEYAKMAGRIGCSLEDMSLFMITHIYCENLKQKTI